MFTEPTQTHEPASAAQSAQATPSRPSWIIPVVCAVITALGAAYTTYSNHKTQSDIETLKANSEQQVTRIKADTEREIKQAELRAQENILRVKDQLDAERDLRAQKAADESSARIARGVKCDEMKSIRNSMSSDIAHVQYGDPRLDDALLSLQAAGNKLTSYLTNAGVLAIKASLSEENGSDLLQRRRDYYSALLEGYNAEIRYGCVG